MAYNPTQRTFRNRLNYLLERDSSAGVEAFYGRSRETIRRWANGSQQPSAAVKRSVVARGARAAGGSAPLPGYRGISDPRARKAIASINRARAENAATLRRNATNDRQRRAADLLAKPLSEEEARNLDQAFARAIELTATNAPERQRYEAYRDIRRSYQIGIRGRPIDNIDEDEEIVVERRRTRSRPRAYVVKRGKVYPVQKGPRGGIFYVQNAGFKAYVEESEVIGTL